MTSSLIERTASIREAEARDSAAFHDEQMQAYRAILARADSPLPEDAQNLITISDDLKLTPERVEADCKTVARYMRLSASAVQYGSLHLLEVKAREDLRRVRRECEKAVQTADAEQAKMSNRASASLNASAELEILQRQHPALFPPNETPTP